MRFFKRTEQIKPLSETKNADLEQAVLAEERAAKRLLVALGVTSEERDAYHKSIERLLVSPLNFNKAR